LSALPASGAGFLPAPGNCAIGTLVIGETGQLARALRIAAPNMTFLGRDALDLADPAAAEEAVVACAPRLVINAAAYTAVDRAEIDAATAEAVNRDGVAALARAAARTGAALVHVSTDYVFDGSKQGEWVETDPTGPLGVYGASKLAGEAVALAANPRTLVLRTSWAYSPWGRNFVTTMLRLADRERLTVVDDQFGKPSSALDLAEAILGIAPRLVTATEETAPCGVFHYAGRGVTSWAGFAREIFSQARGVLVPTVPEIVPIPGRDYPTPARRPANSALDCAAFERVFGIATVDWRAALARVIGQIAEETRPR